MAEGHIRVFRKVLDSAIWQNINDWRLAETILLMANWKEGVFQSRSGDVVKVRRGQVVTSLTSLSEKSGLTVQNVRTSLEHLNKAEFLTDESTSHFRTITVVNYRKYQDLDERDNRQSNRDLTGSQQGLNRDLTAIEAVKQLSSKAVNKKIPDPRVGGLIKIFHETLRQTPGYQEAKINGAVLGSVLKSRLSELGETEVARRIKHWFESTDHFIRRNLNNAGIFGQKFHELNGGPIHGNASGGGGNPAHKAGYASPDGSTVRIID